MKELARRQNESELLKIQFASRMLFNLAEKENYLVWVLCMLSVLAGFVSGYISTWIIPIVIIVTDILAFIFEKKMEKDILHAANLRNIFDRCVFKMPQTLSTKAIDELYEVAENLSKKYHEEYILQTTHTGSDIPPGVKDWYNTNIEIPAHTPPVFSLIKENNWWDKKMVARKYIVYSIAALIIIILTVLFCHTLPLTDVLVILAGILGLLIRLVEKIFTMYKYQKISIQMDGFVENFENFEPDKGLNVLQNKIEERRQLPIVHCNAIHKRLAKKLHEKYETIHKKHIN